MYMSVIIIVKVIVNLGCGHGGSWKGERGPEEKWSRYSVVHIRVT